jgi:hypothetical protein
MINQAYIKSVKTTDNGLTEEKYYPLVLQISTPFFPSRTGILVINDNLQMAAYDSELFVKQYEIETPVLL